MTSYFRRQRSDTIFIPLLLNKKTRERQSAHLCTWEGFQNHPGEQSMKRIIPILSLFAMFSFAASAADIVDTAVSAGNFTTLVAAVKAAGLVDTLKGAGPFTVFAPTDEAFAKLPPGTVEALLKDPEKLKTILLCHVVSGKVMAAQVIKMKSAMTAEGSPVKIHVSGGSVMVNDAKVTKTDIVCDNGVIHVIDTVLMPKPKS
jgi:uncharacterized surface protein with fasciclin (FAS1) repeats